MNNETPNPQEHEASAAVTQETPAPKKTSRKQMRYLPHTIVLEESGHVPIAMWTTATICAIIIALIIWASLTTVKETAMTMGEITPTGQTRVIQHLEGGIIETVLVNDGDQVKQGQLLVQLSKAQAYADLEQARSRELGLLLDNARLKAFINGITPDMTKWKQMILLSRFYTGQNQDAIDAALSEEQQQYNLQQQSLNDQMQVIKSQLKQHQDELTKVQQQADSAAVQLTLLLREKKMYDDLGSNIPISQKDYLSILRNINETQGVLNQVPGQEAQAEAAIAESQNRLIEAVSDARSKASDELSKNQAQLDEVRHEIDKIQDRVQRLNVTSPVNGIVQGLDIKPGNVIQPGGKLMEIVPDDERLVAKVKINTKDIGFVNVGQPVSVRVVTFDYSRFGDIPGHLESVSATTFTDEKTQQPYYEGIVALDRNYAGTDPKEHLLKPGMTVQANIVTGEKTVMAYLLKPIKTTVTSSLNER